ncbi:serine hydrolase [Streptomyces aureoversilis]|uniref:Serine hydrolase n=1 Tax=Streptomyces aureoversilis TaxID=67277 RepID=A0ABW0A554_9ACTN
MGPALDGIVAEGVPGAIAEVRDRDRVWRAGSGTADLRDGRRAKPGDRFRAGSVTKTFVAMVVLQLADEGGLGLDDPVGSHLPGLVSDGGRRRARHRTPTARAHQRNPELHRRAPARRRPQTRAPGLPPRLPGSSSSSR